MKPFGINLISTFMRSNSITYVAHNLANVLLNKNVPVSLVNVRLQTDPVKSLPAHLMPYLHKGGLKSLPHPINLYVLPVNSLARLMDYQPDFYSQSRIHVSNLWWELSQFPLAIKTQLARYDVLLTHSNFLANLASSSIPSTHIIDSPLTWPVDKQTAPNRSFFELPQDDTLFLFVFDADSDWGTVDPVSGHGRKNPLELIDTFLKAFPSGESGMRLVIRANHIEEPKHRDLFDKLVQFTQLDRRIHLIRGELNFSSVMALTASCDVYVSLHRGEGLGLGMLEAMALGKPVIATAWSGNMSFMDLSSACLVRSNMETLSATYRYLNYPLSPGTFWAQPNLADAIAYMRLLHNQPEYRQALGQRARLKYLAYQARANQEAWIEELQAFCQVFSELPKIAGKYSSGSFN